MFRVIKFYLKILFQQHFIEFLITSFCVTHKYLRESYNEDFNIFSLSNNLYLLSLSNCPVPQAHSRLVTLPRKLNLVTEAETCGAFWLDNLYHMVKINQSQLTTQKAGQNGFVHMVV